MRARRRGEPPIGWVGCGTRQWVSSPPWMHVCESRAPPSGQNECAHLSIALINAWGSSIFLCLLSHVPVPCWLLQALNLCQFCLDCWGSDLGHLEWVGSAVSQDSKPHNITLLLLLQRDPQVPSHPHMPSRHRTTLMQQ